MVCEIFVELRKELSTMACVLSLQQSAVMSLVRVLCMQTDTEPCDFLDRLPLPMLIRNNIKVCCTSNVTGAVISRILICNVWLSDENNYHTETIRAYHSTLLNLCDELLKDSMEYYGL